MKRKPRGYWTKEKCKEVALNCDGRLELGKRYKGAYESARKNKWLDDICSHIKDKRVGRTKIFWTKQKCKEAALKCDYKEKFKRMYAGAYNSTIKNNWYVELTSHMIELHKPQGYWDKKHCRVVASKCNSRSEFSTYKGAYESARKNKWLDDICSHMKTDINGRYIIYAYEFPDNHVYVGLTRTKSRRFNYHKTNETSSVYQHSEKTFQEPIYKILWEDGIYSADIAKEKEKYYLQMYIFDGWIKLNKVKTGSIGGNKIKWTKEKCKKSALKCKTRSEFQNKYSGAYNTTRKNKWLDDFCYHMEPKLKWNYNVCKEIIPLVKNRTDLRNKYKGAYESANKRGWLDDFFLK